MRTWTVTALICIMCMMEPVAESKCTSSSNSSRVRSSLLTAWTSMKAISKYGSVAKKKFYANGDTYVGTLRDEQRHGKGTMIFYESGSHYYGDWIDDKRIGMGIIKYSDGSSYEGEFRNDMCNGRGVFRWANGDAFDGYWCNDKRNGSGKYIFADGTFYEGVWHEGAAMTDTSSIFRSDSNSRLCCLPACLSVCLPVCLSITL